MGSTLKVIYGMVYKMIARSDEAADIAQETFIKVWEKRHTLQSDKSLLSWTKKIAVNKCYDYLRKEKRNKTDTNETELSGLISGIGADDKINDEEYQRILIALTEMLSPRQKLVFTLSVIEKLSSDEISELTGMTKTSIKSNLHHARKSVQKKAERIM